MLDGDYQNPRDQIRPILVFICHSNHHHYLCRTVALVQRTHLFGLRVWTEGHCLQYQADAAGGMTAMVDERRMVMYSKAFMGSYRGGRSGD